VSVLDTVTTLDMTYNVFSGTLNPTQSINLVLTASLHAAKFG